MKEKYTIEDLLSQLLEFSMKNKFEIHVPIKDDNGNKEIEEINIDLKNKIFKIK